MKKLVLVLAMGALLPMAQAQSTVTISGLIDAYVGSTRMAGDAGRTNVVGSGGMTTSWLGFSGTEDLGGGLNANFKLGSFMRNDTGASGRFNGDPFFARDASVALNGGFGGVRIGRGLAPNLVPTIVVNPFGDSFNFSPLILHANINTARWAQSTTPSDTGWANEVIYSTPNIAGLSGNLHYQFGEQVKTSNSGSNLDGKNNVGVNATYFAGPVTLAGFYERDQISNPIPSVLTATVAGVTGVPITRKDWMLGGAYDFSLVKLYASYGQSKTDLINYLGKTTSLGVSVPVGATPGVVQAAIARTKVTGAYEGTRTTASLGYDYFLSKRTDLYAVLMSDRITSLNSGTSVGLGMRNRF